METFLFTLFGSVIAFYLAVGGLLLALFVAELNDYGFGAAIAFSIFLGLNYFWGTAPIAEIFTLTNVGLYIVTGFIFSLIRTYFKGKELDTEDKKYFNLKAAVFRWWFLWPISAINWLFGRLLRDAYNWIYVRIAKVFEYLFGMPEEDNSNI